MQFSDIVGQDKIISELVNVIQAQQLPHAVLLVGKKGWGGLPLGLALAQYLMCEQPQEDSCGQCTNCQMMSKLSHPDVAYTFPTIKLPKYSDNLSEYFIDEFRSFAAQTPYDNINKWLQFINAENSQGNISADQCRKIMDFFSLKSYQGNKKIHIMWLPEYLGKEGNILLKLIEEPPADSYLIFISEQEHQILGTIRSRLQKFELKPIAAKDIVTQLVTRHQVPQAKAENIARLTYGDYEKALELCHDLNNDAIPLVEQFIHHIYNNNGIGIIEWVDEMSKSGREAIKSMLQYIEHTYNQALRVQYGQMDIQQFMIDEQKIISTIQQHNLPIDAYMLIKEGLQKTIYAISRNAHTKTQLLNMCIEMQYWIKNRTLAVK